MRQIRKRFEWAYLIQAEDSMTPAYGRLAGACKTCMWLGVSILIGVGVAQLT